MGSGGDPNSVVEALAAPFGREEPPTGLLAMLDAVALRALDRLAARGIATPGEVSVAGFGGVPEAAQARPPP